MDSIELLWDALLSREPERIQFAYEDLSLAEKEAVIEHLKSMATENSWHVEQKLSAQSALDVIKSIDTNKSE
jgi:hypothetical protein